MWYLNANTSTKMLESHAKSEESPIDSNQTISYLYIAVWSYLFYFRQAVVGKVAPAALVILFSWTCWVQ